MAQTAARLERQCLCPGRRTGHAGGYVDFADRTRREPPPPRTSVRLPATYPASRSSPRWPTMCCSAVNRPRRIVCPPAAGIRHRRARLLQLSRHGRRQLVPCRRRAAGRRPSAAGRRPARHPAPVRARAAAPAFPASRPHAAGHVLRCGQKHPGRRLLPHPASGPRLCCVARSRPRTCPTPTGSTHLAKRWGAPRSSRPRRPASIPKPS